MKTKHDNDLIDHIGAVYTKNYIELSRLIGPAAVYTKTRQNNYAIDMISAVYVEKEFELLWLIRSSMACDKNHTW